MGRGKTESTAESIADVIDEAELYWFERLPPITCAVM